MSSGEAVTGEKPGAPLARAGVQAGRVVRPEFTGSAREYFRIWIVNLFFTLITLGIYSAWAKVRKKRYFYGCTRIDGDSFDYFGSPKMILKGRVVAFVVFVTYAFASELYPPAAFAFWGLAILMLPWLVVRAFKFNARNSAYRGLRLDFTATTGQAARLYLGRFLVVILTLGLAFPWFMARQKEFVISNHAFGKTGFGCEIHAGEFFGFYLLGGLIVTGLAVPPMILMGAAMHTDFLRGAFSWVGIVAPIALIYAAYAVGYAFIQARTTNLMWNGTYGPGVRFASSLAAAKLARLYIGNITAIVASVGLLIPWAVIRMLRYRLENFSMILEEEAPHEASPELERVGAAGQELGDIFNLDLGI